MGALDLTAILFGLFSFFILFKQMTAISCVCLLTDITLGCITNLDMTIYLVDETKCLLVINSRHFYIGSLVCALGK